MTNVLCGIPLLSPLLQSIAGRVTALTPVVTVSVQSAFLVRLMYSTLYDFSGEAVQGNAEG